MKIIVNFSLWCLVSIFYLGCSPISERSLVPGKSLEVVKHPEISIINDYTLATVYIDENENLIDIKDADNNIENNPKGLETLYITESGFYPEHYFTGEISCMKKYWGSEYTNKACYSIFSKTDLVDSIIRNSIVAVGTLGVGTLYGGKYTIINFDYEKFYKFIEENGLIEKRKELLTKIELERNN